MYDVNVSIIKAKTKLTQNIIMKK